MSKNLLKRIVKVFSIVLLCAVVFVGLVTAFLAIRGDFKKKKIKPTAISFEVGEMELVYDVDTKYDGENLLPHFTISAQPADVTERECRIIVSDPNLITFKKFVDGEWVDYTSQTFYLNEKIYFEINSVESNNIVGGWDNYYNDENPVTDYRDGILTITVVDSSGLLSTTMTMEIDRDITSVSLKDVNNTDNNQVNNGKFYYERDAREGESVVQKIDAIINQDFEFNVISAPLMSLDPFAGEGEGKDPKTYEIYYMDQGTPKRLVQVDGVAKLEVITNATTEYEDCDFLRYDAEKKKFILNSSRTAQYDFRLAVYKNYVDEQTYRDRTDLTLAEKLSHMLQKDVSILVSGTDAHNIQFNTDNNTFDLTLFEENSLVVNNNQVNGMFNLGLTLSKSNSDGSAQTEITGRFDELNFLDSTDFKNQVEWTLKAKEKVAVKDEEADQVTYENVDRTVTISMYGDGAKKAKVSGLSSVAGLEGVTDAVEFDVKLEYPSGMTNYVLTLTHTKDNGGETETYKITFNLNPSVNNSRMLNIIKVGTQPWMAIEYSKGSATDIIDCDLDYEGSVITSNIGDRLIYTVKSNGEYDFKALNSGVYLLFLDENLNNLGDKFQASVSTGNGKNNIVTIKPLDGAVESTQKRLYAMVVNNDGQYAYTDDEGFLLVNVISSATNLYFTEEGKLGLPITVSANELGYGHSREVADIVGTNGGSYKDAGVLLFAPKYYKLNTEPTDWGIHYTNYYQKVEVGVDNIQYVQLPEGTAPNFADGEYYAKNHYKFIDCIKYEVNNIEYFLLGDINAAGKFVNKVIATDLNKESVLYPFVPQVKYLTTYDRVQTASEYVDELLSEVNTMSSFRDAKNSVDSSWATEADVKIYYDTTLLSGRKLYKYVKANESEEWGRDSNVFYNIISAKDCGDGYIEIEAKQVVGGVEQETIEYFKILKSVYEDDLNNAISLDCYLFTASDENKNRQITTYNYYNLDEANLVDLAFAGKHFEIGFTDSYFEAPNNKDNAGNYYVVEDYLNMNADIKVDYSTEATYIDKPLKDMTAFIELGFNWDIDSTITNEAAILEHIKDNLIVTVHEYDSNGIRVGTLMNEALFSSAAEVQSSVIELVDIYGDDYAEEPPYYENRTYGKMISGEFSPLGGKPADWATNWKDYSVEIGAGCLAIKINPEDSLNEGHFLKIQVSYAMGIYSKSWQSDRLYIRPNDVANYYIKTDKEVYQATKVTSETAPTDWTSGTVTYYKLEGNEFKKLETKPEYVANTYYTLNTDNLYNGEIRYQMVIGYEGGYNYTVYAMDNNDNYLFGQSEGKYTLISTPANTAFNGWIKYNPYYAKEYAYSIQPNDYITFDGTNVTNAEITNGQYQPVVIKNTTNYKTFTIQVKVVAPEGENGFVFDVPTKVDSSTEEATISPTYTYSGTSILSEVSAEIINLGGYNKISGNVDGETWENPNNTNDKITLTRDGNSWKVTRSEDSANIDITIRLTSKLGHKECVVSFKSPYSLTKSSENTTDKIYGGTTFAIAYYNTEGAHNLDYVYSIIDASKKGFTIKYSYVDKYGVNQEAAILGAVSNEMLMLVPNDIDKETKITFSVIYNGKIKDTFELNIMPNKFVVTESSDAILLNDSNNNTYDLRSADGLAVYSYNTGAGINYKQYAQYIPAEFADGVYECVDGKYKETEDAVAQEGKTYYINVWETVAAEEKNYEGRTYLDEECKVPYRTNIATIYNKTLTINPISEIGTYYIKLDIIVDSIVVGNIKLKVEAQSKVDVNGGDVELTAKTTETFTLDQLNSKFSDSMYIPTNSHIENVTYYYDINNKKYVLGSDGSNKYYFKSNGIADFLWLDNSNENLEIIYNYADGINQLIQRANLLRYNGVTYTYIGTSYNWDEYTYVEKMSDSALGERMVYKGTELVSSTSMGASIKSDNVIHVNNSIYCIKNAYLFEAGNTILVISAEKSGKVIYIFDTVNSTVVKETHLGQLQSLTLTYNGFGNNAELSTLNASVVDTISYNAEFIVGVDNDGDGQSNIYHNIKPATPYNINIKPYILSVNEDKTDKVLIANEDIVLLNETGIGDNGLLIKSDDIINVEFGDSDDLRLTYSSNKYSINPLAKGNGYTTKLRIKLTYSDGSTYSYDEEITVYNTQAVNIITPYDSTNANSMFSANVTELSNDASTTLEYTATDLINWLGGNTFKFDLALKGDVINLVNDDLLNIKRYEVYNRLTETATYAKDTYYQYNNGRYELLTGETEPAGWAKYWNFYTKQTESSAPAKIELVAVSSGLASTLQQVKNNITISNGKIAISSLFEYTGYLAFKVYISDSSTSPYGYYIVKVVDDDNFNQVLNLSTGRNIRELPVELTSGEDKIINVVRGTYDITTVANISNSLIEIDNSNIYLFAVDSCTINGVRYAKGELIPRDTILTSGISTKSIEVAVVLSYNTSLVHLCNYNIILQSTIEVDVNTTYVKEDKINSNYYIYDAVAISYDYENTDNNANNNAKLLKDYLTVENGAPQVDLLSVEVLNDYTIEGSGITLTNSSGITIEDASVKYDGKEIANISGTTAENFELNITTTLSSDVYFYLKLTYECGDDDFVAYVRININKYTGGKGQDGSTFGMDVGQYEYLDTNGDGEKDTYGFNKTITLEDLIGSYAIRGNVKIEASIDNANYYENGDWDSENNKISTYCEYEDKTFTFVQTAQPRTIFIKITLEDAANPIERIYSIQIASGIADIVYDTDGDDGKEALNPIKVDAETELSEIGSKLYVNISNNVLTIKSAEDGTTYATINTSSISKVSFELRGGVNKYNNYFVKDSGAGYYNDNEALIITESGYINFTHSAKAIDLRLIINISNSSSEAYGEKVLYIRLPQTYSDLESIYRVKGAAYETVKVGSSLLIKASSEEAIASNLLGTDNNCPAQTGSSEPSKVYESRFAFTFKGATYYGYNNLVMLGLYTANNPNKLSFEFDESGNLDSAEFVGGELNFKAEGFAIINLKNSTMDEAIRYEFRVMSKEGDYNNITINENLLLNKDANGDEYITLNFQEINSGNLYLAAYQYIVTGQDGQVGYLTTDNSDFTLKIDDSSDANRYKVVIDVNRLTNNFNKIKVNIITMNGVARPINIIITNYVASYGYANASYETLYANTEGYKFTDNATGFKSGETAKQRMTLTNGGDYVFKYNTESKKYEVASEYGFEYIGMATGVITSANAIPNSLPTNGLAQYDAGIMAFKLLSTTINTYVTMVFDVKYTDDNVTYIIGKAFYALYVKNDIRIGMNGLDEDASTIDMYLGSYTFVDNKTTINLMQHTFKDANGNVTAYNNVFITLERFSDGYTIANKSALYNGGSGTSIGKDEYYSYLSVDEVSRYLTFKITKEAELEPGNAIELDSNGKLTVIGNPNCSIEIIVGYTGVVGYYKTFTINIHSCETIDANWDSSRNGTPLESDRSEIKLLAFNNSGYDINVYTTKYGKDGSGKLAIFNDTLPKEDFGYSVTVAVFPITTSISTIKSSTSWNVITPNITGEKCSVTLPPVPYSTNDNDKYYIVSYRVAITINSVTHYYYAHYTVYNNTKIIVNDYYLQDEKYLTLTYGDSAWAKKDSSGNDGKTITIMDFNNTGLYTAFNPIILTSKPTSGTYYQKNKETGIYTLADFTNEFIPGEYHVTTDIFNNPRNYEFWVKSHIKKVEAQLKDVNISADDPTKLIGTLPEGLFDNSDTITLTIKHNTAKNLPIYTQDWTIKSDSEITPVSSVRLSELFLRSEIGDELYNQSIIGIINNTSIPDIEEKNFDIFNYFVSNGECSECETALEVGSRSILKVTYTGTGESPVFNNTATFYVLASGVEHSAALGFNFNGGTYYINVIVDDNNEMGINLLNYTKVYYLEADSTPNKLKIAYKAATSVVIDGYDTNMIEKSGNMITPKSHNENFFTTITLDGSDGSVTTQTREIQLYFNFIINAKNLDAGSTLEDPKMAYNKEIVEAINIADGATSEVTDSVLKSKLLQLITYNNNDVNEGDYDKFTIEVTNNKNTDNSYSIKYTYSYSGIEYVRTFTMSQTEPAG